MFLGVTALMALICWWFVAKYLFSSPADDARMVTARIAQGKPLPAKFNASLLDANDPAFSVPTWRYALSRWREGQ